MDKINLTESVFISTFLIITLASSLFTPNVFVYSSLFPYFTFSLAALLLSGLAGILLLTNSIVSVRLGGSFLLFVMWGFYLLARGLTLDGFNYRLNYLIVCVLFYIACYIISAKINYILLFKGIAFRRGDNQPAKHSLWRCKNGDRKSS